MAVKFFGQFLIEQGEIDAEQLCAALDLMRAENRQLGAIGVEKGFLRQTDADWINLQQRITDQNFGEIACNMGLLGARELDEIVAIQLETRLFVGEALVQLGSLPEDRLPTLLDRFKLDQAPYETEQRKLDADLGQNPAAPLVLDLLPKLCLRMATVQMKIGSGQPLSRLTSYPFNVRVSMSGAKGLSTTLVCDEVFGRRLAASVSGLDIDRLSTELIYDGIGEFLNVICGNVVAILEREGIIVQLEPPVRDQALEAGTVFEIVVSEGAASLVLESL